MVGLLLLAVVIGSILLWRANQAGFRGEWSTRLRDQLEAQGLHADFSSARLSFSQGLIARDLKIYTDEKRTELLASTDQLFLDIDRASALRGNWQVRSARFENAFIRLPKQSAPHHLSQLTGTATICRENCLKITQASGLLGQLAIEIETDLTDFAIPKANEDELKEAPPWEEFLVSLHQEVEQWSCEEEAPPKLTLSLTGNLSQPSTLRGEFTFQAPRITRRQYTMDDLILAGRVTRSSVQLDEISFQDMKGRFEGNGHYDFISRISRFEAESKASLERLLRDGLAINKLEGITFHESPLLRAKGTLHLPKGQVPKLSLTGELEVANFHFLKSDWSRLTSHFSWQSGNLFLRDLVLTHPEGSLQGKLLFQDDNVRYEARSTLPVQLFDPFIKPTSKLRKTFNLMEFTEESQITLDLAGTLRPSNLKDWTAAGHLKVENFSYNKVALHYGSTTFSLTPLQATFTQPEIEIDLRENATRKKFGGPESAIVRAASVQYDRAEQLTHINHIHGICWPASVLRLFLPKTADYLERTYQMSEPPAFSSSGVVDHVKERKGTSFHTRMQTAAPLYYRFLGQDVELRETSVLVHTHHRQVDITDLSSYVFSGPIQGELTILLPNQPGLPSNFRGEILWTRLRMADIGDTYGFEKIEKGLVTGRLDFSGTAGKIESLEGTGNIGLEKGELFKAPVFGPLSPFIASIQGHQKASHETARDASANFLIRKGVLYTDDFITSTDSLTVQAEGSIDLVHKNLNMTARADTEGILKLVTLPLNLTGFSGLLQFQGTGPLSDPKWVNTPFTRPKKVKKTPLFAPPPKGRVVPE